MRICTRCNQQKDDADCVKREKGRIRNLCKVCFGQYQMIRWNRRKIQAIDYLGGKCSDCGIIDHPCAYDFHHVGEKDVEWGKLRIRSWDKITKELDKCILLCAICHKKKALKS